MRPGEGRHAGGFLEPWKGHTVTEREAVDILRTFTPEEVAVAITTHVLEQPVQVSYGDPMLKTYKPSYTLEDYVRSRQENEVKQKTPDDITEQIAQGRPDLYNLYHVLDYITSRLSHAVVTAYPDRFAALIGQDTVSVQDHQRMVAELGRRQNFTALQLGIPASFYPRDQRPSLRTFDAHLRPNEFRQIREFTPDIVTGNETSEARFDAIVRMLSMTHDDALAIVCRTNGVDLALLPTLRQENRAAFSAIQRAAGLHLQQNSLVGVLHDYAGEGYGAVYNHHPENGAAKTERHMCTGYALSDAFIQGLGLALKQNKDRLLELITNPPMQLDEAPQLSEEQQELCHQAELLISSRQQQNGGLSTMPHVARSMKQHILQEASAQLADRNTPPYYRDILTAILAQVEALEI